MLYDKLRRFSEKCEATMQESINTFFPSLFDTLGCCHFYSLMLIKTEARGASHLKVYGQQDVAVAEKKIEQTLHANSSLEILKVIYKCLPCIQG